MPRYVYAFVRYQTTVRLYPILDNCGGCAEPQGLSIAPLSARSFDRALSARQGRLPAQSLAGSTDYAIGCWTSGLRSRPVNFFDPDIDDLGPDDDDP